MQGSGMDVIATHNHRMLLARHVNGRLSREKPIDYETVAQVMPTKRQGGSQVQSRT